MNISTVENVKYIIRMKRQGLTHETFMAASRHTEA